MLYGRANARDLQDHNDRYALRIEIAHACRSSDDTSRQLKDQKQERAENGLPMGARSAADSTSSSTAEVSPSPACVAGPLSGDFGEGLPTGYRRRSTSAECGSSEDGSGGARERR